MTFKKQRFQQKGFNSSACHIYGTFLLSLLFKKKNDWPKSERLLWPVKQLGLEDAQADSSVDKMIHPQHPSITSSVCNISKTIV